MDPARLAELEAAWPLNIPVPPNLPVTMKATVVIHELIAEIRRLKHPTVTVSWKGGQEIFPLDKVVFHIERLQVVREAAEAYLQTYGEHPDSRGTLRRALDNVKTNE